MKAVIVVGGPNGAGKTTAASTLLPRSLGIIEFVNADEIARGLSPFNPEGSALAAGRLMLERMQMLAQAGASFAFETTLSGRSHARFLRTCRAAGYELNLVYLWLPSAQDALARVARRVRKGGHHVPDEVVVRRYEAGLRNMRHLYWGLADTAVVYDNSGPSILIAERLPDAPLIVHDRARWSLIEEATK